VEPVVLAPVRAAPRVLDVLAAVLDAPARAWPGVQDGAAALGVLAAVPAAPQVLDVLVGAPDAPAAVRVAPRVPDVLAGAQDVLVAAPAGSRLVPPPWWALCGLAADALPEPPDAPARLADGRVACGSELRRALRQAR
jgi:hypothetical protein